MKGFFDKLLLLLCVVCYTSAVSAQSSSSARHYVMLKSGTKTLSANVDAFIASPNLSASELNNAYFYRLIQFNNIPTQLQQNQIELAGIKLLEYIPHNAYVAAIPTNLNFQLLATFDVRTITTLDATDKMDEYLRSEVYPDWAVDGSEVQLYVKLNDRIAYTQVLADFIAEGARNLKYYPRNNLVYIKMSQEAASIRSIAAIPYVSFVETTEPPSVREDQDGRGLHRANMLNQAAFGGLRYDGAGLAVQTRDDGAVGPHIDFQGRMEQVNTNGTGSHGDGVAGIMAGAGNLNAFMQGGASGSFMYVTDYVANFQDTTYGLHLYHGVQVTNSSYSNGCNAGYTTITQTVDDQINNSPTYLHVFSAGNSNNQNCGYGAGNQWGNITGGHKIGKNVIATANLNGTGVLQNSSSRGPASDGRLKPDLAAYGQGQFSTDENNTYQSFGGTSAASPSVAGVMTQLMHAYQDMNNGQLPESALLKAAAMNTAKDLGNFGPDYRFGWGLINGYKAYNLLKDGRYMSGSVAQGVTNSHSITIPANVVEARIMVYWMEEAGSVIASKALINDLDMSVSDGATTTLPLVLNPTPNATTLNSPAVPGVDTLNNVEQVRLLNPAAGTYTIDVAGTVVPMGSRDYYVVYEFFYDDITITFPNGGEGIDPASITRFHWDAHTTSGNFTIEYSIDSGATWSVISSSVPGANYLFNWNTANVTTDKALLKMSRGSAVDVSDTTFTILGTPSGLSVDTVCASGITVSWNAVSGATSYDVLFLGDKYMEVVGNTTTTSATIPGNPYEDYWVAVRARINDGVGPRSNAIPHNSGLKNCIISDDASISLITPTSIVNECITDSTVVIEVSNIGQDTIFSMPVYYQLNNNTAVLETITDTIANGQSTLFAFSTQMPLTNGSYDLKVWTALNNDQIPFNDTVDLAFEVVGVQSLPFEDNFEVYNNCSTDPDCGTTVCPLGNGWINMTNGIADDIDWRVHEGETFSGNTGPTTDANPGTPSGHYLYIEASGGCNQQTASLISPCLDLTAATNPFVSMMYHMFGNNMGELHIDVLDNGVFTNDIITPITGNQGDLWQNLAIDLSAYTGKVINLRIRGITGSGFASDLAIDAFKSFDFTDAPTVQFSADETTTCPTTAVSFTDQSLEFVTGWQWTFSPNTVTFVNGTSATSANPQVLFNNLGTYDVKLVATNANGSDSASFAQFITVTSGAALPYSDDFESYNNCGTASNCADEICSLGNGWFNAENGADDNIDWRVDNGGTPSAGTGPATDHNPGTGAGKYLYLEASNGCNGQFASLISPCIDLTNATNPYFSIWYHMFGSDMGSLHLDIYSNGIWIDDIAPSISGNQGDQWREMQASLLPYIGQSVVLRVRGITGAGFESDIAIDDASFYEITTPPVAALSVVGTPCAANTEFVDNSTNGATSWTWDFGTNATPATATGAGPHNVAFSGAGTYNVQLIATSPIGSDTTIQTITVDDVPAVDFSWTTNNENITFSNNSTNGTSYSWDFGDGTSTGIANPGLHVYTTSGIFTVTLTATNQCGSNSISKDVAVVVTNTNNLAKNWYVGVTPNPSNGQFNLTLDGIQGDINVTINDIQGKEIRQWNFTNTNSTWTQPLDATDLASGIYILRVGTAEGIKNVKLIIE